MPTEKRSNAGRSFLVRALLALTFGAGAIIALVDGSWIIGLALVIAAVSVAPRGLNRGGAGDWGSAGPI